MKIYVASSWRNEYQPAVVQAFKLEGHEVYDFRNAPDGAGFGWEDIIANGGNATIEERIEALAHPAAVAGFTSDASGMEWAEVCVLVLPCGRSAHLEAGWFAGKGRLLVIYSPEQFQPELMYKFANLVTNDLEAILDYLNEMDLDALP